MLIGMGQKKTPAAAGGGSADIYPVAGAEFETKIIAESQKRPILIEFWASWCGPCKQLMPVLEDIVTARKGALGARQDRHRSKS